MDFASEAQKHLVDHVVSDLLCTFPKLGDECSIRHGVEWKLAARGTARDTHVSEVPRRGFRQGYHLVEHMNLYTPPPVEYLDWREGSRRCNAPFNYPWDEKKVILPTAHVGRNPWCIAAFPDEEGLPCSHTLTAVWPNPGRSVKTLAAILNGPVASAFVALRELNLHVSKEILAGVPLPSLDPRAARRIDTCVAKYMRFATSANNPVDAMRDILLVIDLEVLKGYHLPPPVERTVLELFRGHNRPIPFPFDDYVERMIQARLKDQLRILEEDEEEQGVTWEYLKKALDEDRLSYRKLFS